MKKLNYFVIGLLALATYSCQKSKTNDLKEAQLCLNNSPAAEAMACVDKIADNSTAQAYKLRCSAVFISQGFNTPVSFTSALDHINGGTGTCSGGCSSTVDALNSFNFHNGDNLVPAGRDANNAIAAQAFEYCSLSETNIYMQISSLFRIGTLAAMEAYALGATSTPTADQIKAALGSLPAADVGAIVTATYAATCQDVTNASDSTKQYCAQLGTAVNGGGTTEQIGTCLQNKLQNPSYTNPAANCP